MISKFRLNGSEILIFAGLYWLDAPGSCTNSAWEN